ncbi:hypothetical protein UFOVP700_23 [uncultured Caudovirales phage]|uniref:HK97 gp10 family phage protein n=1 Tax=uncultured Caudovirales phage TaxID=2100421 RepID=A0A6J5NI58_9CAUD|nr:hypothetical protein UFOVP700_23 [uncultured Caudovirales phage]
MARVNLKSFERQMRQAERVAEDLPEQAYRYFVSITPRDQGRARRSTRLENDTIVADYPYSQRLDQGYSKQAPQGMSKPTEQWIEQQVERKLKGV